ncbi:hypothetical protein K457DRAFT_177188 [Linnemannia elongata AG-77]|uniref:Uncharacterized protein n=1 Tax=Linnemannia elongata AG-77 TaxID=1314771 RepID=A0A197KJE2_9FUNG|nr:hypothetical protein K457DRAFT_177188 [Linnemannia elongata AG-77]
MERYGTTLTEERKLLSTLNSAVEPCLLSSCSSSTSFLFFFFFLCLAHARNSHFIFFSSSLFIIVSLLTLCFLLLSFLLLLFPHTLSLTPFSFLLIIHIIISYPAYSFYQRPCTLYLLPNHPNRLPFFYSHPHYKIYHSQARNPCKLHLPPTLSSTSSLSYPLAKRTALNSDQVRLTTKHHPYHSPPPLPTYHFINHHHHHLPTLLF